MATTTTNATHSVHFNPLSALGDAVLGFFVRLAENNPRLREVERLNAMSDEQLKRIGIKREDIARYVYRDMYFV